MDVDRFEDSNKNMRRGALQNQDDVESMISGISNDMLLVLLAQGHKEMQNRQWAEQRKFAASSEGGQEG